MDKVAYIIQIRPDAFRGYVALLNPDGDDAALFVTASTNKFATVEQVQEEMKKLPSEIKTFMNPITPNQTGISWLSELEEANQQK